MRRRLLALCLTAGLIGFGGADSTIAALTQGPPPPPQQAPPPGPPPPPTQQVVGPAFGTGAISGVVMDGVTKQPIEGALVLLVAQGPATPGARPRQRTDARGRFIFHRLPAFETYGLQVSRQGYFDAGFKGAPGSAISRRIALRDGEWFTKADLFLWKPAAISGTVRDERGEPVVGVSVRSIMQVSVGGHMRLASGTVVMTDDRGMYRLPNLTAGRYLVHVPSVQITLPDGTAAVGYTAAASMSGNAPAAVPEPLALMRSEDSGRSDGLGLVVGHFPTPLPGNAATAYPMAYHPSARSADDAEAVTVGYGEQRTNVDVTLGLVPTVRVSGQVVGPAEGLAKIPVRLTPVGAENLGEGSEAAITLTDATGQFTFLRVPAGDYVVIASTTETQLSGNATSRSLMPARVGFFAGSMAGGTIAGSDNLRYMARSLGGRNNMTGRVPLTVSDKDVANVAVPVQPGVTVSGSFLWDGSQTPPAGVRNAPFLRLEPADGNLSFGLPAGGSPFAPQGGTLPTPVTFELTGVLPGRYVLGEGLGAGSFSMEAVEYGGQDLLTTPLVVTGDKSIRDIVIRLVSQRITLNGRVSMGNGAVPEDAAVIIFPADRALWRDYGLSAQRFKTATVTASGTFVAPPGLPPGEYYAVAVPNADRLRWTDTEFLNTLVGRAARIRLAPGSPITVDLRFDGVSR